MNQRRVRGLSELVNVTESVRAYEMMPDGDVVWVDTYTGVAYQFDIDYITKHYWAHLELEDFLAST